MIRGIAICRHFQAEFRAALEAEGLDGVPVHLFRGGCEGGPWAGPGLGGEDGVVRLAGDCAGPAGPGSGPGSGPSSGFDTCFAMLVGQVPADTILGQGIHLLTPSMVRAWGEASRPWGFTGDQARAFFGEAIRGFRVIDCGVSPIDPRDLELIREETGLPVDLWPATLDPLRRVLRQTLAPGPVAPPGAWTLSDYAMTYDLLARMVPLEREAQITREIASLFLMLCAPGRVVLDLAAWGHSPALRLVLPEGLEQAPAGAGAADGFDLDLSHHGVHLGRLTVEALAFPARRDHYRHLGGLLAPMLSLLLANVRTRGQLLAAIVESSDDAIISKTLDGTITSWNQAAFRMFGYTAEEAIGRPLAMLVPPDRLEEEAGILARIRAGAPVQHIETVRLRKDGTPIQVSVTLSPIRDTAMAIIGASKIVRDITDRKKAEELQHKLEAEVQQAQKFESIGHLAGGIAHDMNNVLGAIQAVTQTLQVVHAGEPELTPSLEIISKATLRGRDMVKSLTTFARKDLREPAWIDLNILVHEAIALLDRTTLNKVEFAQDLQEGLPQVLGERGPLASALLNLCLNAVDAMPQGGRLTLSTRTLPGPRIALAVQDTGEGMTPAVLAKAVEPFFTTKPVGKGTGLGLAMVYSTVRAHGGTLELTSEEGRGTRAVLALPARVHPEGAPGAPPQAARHGRPLAILLVDDDALIRASVPALLATLGHRVETLEGGRQALAALAAGQHFDLVILDLNMPGMNGAETLAALRRLRPRVPVLLATGYLDNETAALLERDPWARSISKPFLVEDLAQKIGALLA